MGKALDRDSLAELFPAVGVHKMVEDRVESQAVKRIFRLGFQEKGRL